MPMIFYQGTPSCWPPMAWGKIGLFLTSVWVPQKLRISYLYRIATAFKDEAVTFDLQVELNRVSAECTKLK